MRVARAALIIMAKAPEPGLAKTRLIPALGADGAAAVARQLLVHTIEAAQKTSMFQCKELCVTPQIDHLAFAAWSTQFVLTHQGDGDLGQRMQHAFERALKAFDMVIMIGTDAPAMTAPILEQALQDLEHHDAVLVPALDGGYTLIGLKQLIPELFADIPWSTDQVMAITRDRLHSTGARWHEYLPMADIDEPHDLVHLPVQRL